MRLYVVVKTARKDVEEFPGYFGSDPRRPTICLIDSSTGDVCTSDREVAMETVKVQAREYGEYFDYTVYELEITDPVARSE